VRRKKETSLALLTDSKAPPAIPFPKMDSQREHPKPRIERGKQSGIGIRNVQINPCAFQISAGTITV
jgi:hypothetical protein